MEHATQVRYSLPILSFSDGEHELVAAFARAAKLFRFRGIESSEPTRRASRDAPKQK